MICNIMNEYIKLVKTQLEQYTKLFFGKKFDREIFNEYAKEYIEVRYYNFDGFKTNAKLKKEIIKKITLKKEQLINDNHKKQEIIQQIGEMFKYILYVDDFIQYNNTNKIIDILSKAYNIESDLKKEIIKIIAQNNEARNEFLHKFESEEFYIKLINKLKGYKVYDVNLKYNFKLPNVYSEFAINKALNEGIISEDKLFVEYSLVSLEIIKNIRKGNINCKYIVDFAESLLIKTKKLERLLRIINNSIIQDKVILKVRYTKFIKNKEEIYSLIKKGYKFALIIDKQFKISLEEIERFNMFDYVLVDQTNRIYKSLISNTGISQKIIKI